MPPRAAPPPRLYADCSAHAARLRRPLQLLTWIGCLERAIPGLSYKQQSLVIGLAKRDYQKLVPHGATFCHSEAAICRLQVQLGPLFGPFFKGPVKLRQKSFHAYQCFELSQQGWLCWEEAVRYLSYVHDLENFMLPADNYLPSDILQRKNRMH